MSFVYIVLPYLILPYLISFSIKRTNWNRKWGYLIAGLLVPLVPFLLVQLGILPPEGMVLVGTSIFALPAVLFNQYLANKYMNKYSNNSYQN